MVLLSPSVSIVMVVVMHFLLAAAPVAIIAWLAIVIVDLAATVVVGTTVSGALINLSVVVAT